MAHRGRLLNQMVKDLATDKDSALQLAGAVQMIDWLTSGELFESHALRVLGLLDLDKEPIQDYMSRDSDTDSTAGEHDAR